MTLVSVIIPCYNAEKWILESLKSVINQTYKNLEIVIIDDGSEDNTAEIIKEINDDRIKYYFKKNGGLSSARNYGIGKSNGELIAFLDSDDQFEATKIEIQLYNIGDYDGIYCNFNLIDYSNNIISSNHNLDPILFNYNFKSEIIKLNRIAGGSTMLIKKSVVDKVGYFNEKLKIGEDWDYWARLIWEDFKLKYLSEKLTKIRVHNGSMQKTTTDKTWFNSIESIYNSFLKFKNLKKREKAIIYRELTKTSYRFNTSYLIYKRNYFLLLKYNWRYIFDIELILLTFKFCLRNLLKKLNHVRN